MFISDHLCLSAYVCINIYIIIYIYNKCPIRGCKYSEGPNLGPATWVLKNATAQHYANQPQEGFKLARLYVKVFTILVSNIMKQSGLGCLGMFQLYPILGLQIGHIIMSPVKIAIWVFFPAVFWCTVSTSKSRWNPLKLPFTTIDRLSVLWLLMIWGLSLLPAPGTFSPGNGHLNRDNDEPVELWYLG